MIFVDTDIVVRFAVNDDPDQAAIAGIVPFCTFDAEFCKHAIGRGNAPPVVNPAK